MTKFENFKMENLLKINKNIEFEIKFCNNFIITYFINFCRLNNWVY